jgi:hypothetical protein
MFLVASNCPCRHSHLATPHNERSPRRPTMFGGASRKARIETNRFTGTMKTQVAI